MSWDVGTPTDKSGPAYGGRRRRRFLKYLGAAAIGFGGGAAASRRGLDDEVVTAIERNNSTSTAGATPTPLVFDATEPTVETATLEPVRTERSHVIVTATVVNPLAEFRRRGLYCRISHDPYESTGNRLVELPGQSRNEYLLRVPRGTAQIESAILHAVENDNYEIETRLGKLPERYGNR